MEGFDPASSFGPDVAAGHDNRPRGDEEAAVAFLSALARGRRALEFAIGTGRIALPLAARDLTVDGIELSPTWSHGSVPSPAAIGSTSRSVT